MAKKLTAIRFKEGDLATLAKIAKREDETVSETIRRAVKEFLKREAKLGGVR
jgi:hypothetical protein